MKAIRVSFMLFSFVLCLLQVRAQTLINTSFEGVDGYVLGNINNQLKWKVTTGSGVVVDDENYVFQGQQALRTTASGTNLQVEQIGYASNTIALGGDVYLDFYIKQNILPTVNYAITGYDLGTNTHRSLMIEFQPNGKLKLYDGSSGWATQPVYAVNTWVRISAKVDNAAGKYQLAINGEVLNKVFNFREIKNNATDFDFHAIRFSMSSGTCDAVVDNLYIGTEPINGISFQESSTERTISVTQPAIGVISLTPQKAKYELNEQVSASIQVPAHYVFSGWTGDLSGTENPKVFQVDKNMAIGANVIIDAQNPPALYAVTVTQPVGGTISLEPQQATYYDGTTIKATLTLESGYQFDGWSGDLSGTTNPLTFVISGNTSIGANVSEINIPPVTRTVSTVTQFKNALNAMNPGDTVLVLDGTYNMGGVKITRGGNTAKPILVKSQNLHGAKITGESAFTLSYQSHVTYEGFDFDVEPVSTIIKMEGCSFVRITRNQFKMKKLSEAQSSKWITIGDIWANPVCNSHHNRIDHNLFDGKYDAGAWLVIDGSHGTIPDISKYDRIDHNIFRNNTPRVANEKETLRIGVSDLSLLNSYTLVENNLFEDCDGDPEIVSVKSCSNIIRGNTFRRCLGTLSLRHGHNTIVEGNFFFGEGKTAQYSGNEIGCGGIRVYGMNHQIYNNYFEGLTGSKWDAAMTITNGDVTNSSSSLTSHFLPENVVFAHNTLINNVSNIEIGFDNNGNYGRAPKNCSIINNLIVSSTNPIVKSFSAASLAGVSFENNLMHATGTASIGLTSYNQSQVLEADPLLVKTKCRAYDVNCNFETGHEHYKLTAASPAINASVFYTLAEKDIEGQAAIGIRDIGADEFNPDAIITNAPMDETTAGPMAAEQYIVETNTSTGLQKPLIKQAFVSPNPFTGTTYLRVPHVYTGNATIHVYDALGVVIKQETVQLQDGVAVLHIDQRGMFFCLVDVSNQQFIFKIISK
ncbi:MAG: chondroitinase-B domain-containing protein [Paludibacter sp.]|nr:chondroitinase-B domain-containing protein [Paludibacter sp.]